MPRWLPNDLLGKRIRDLRRRVLDTSQAGLADMLGIPGSQAEVSQWERGRKRPPYEHLVRIAELAGVELSYFEEPNDGRPELVHEPEAPAADPTVGGGGYLQAMYETLVESREALYAAMTRIGDPGEGEDDKLALIELLGKAVADARKRGVHLSTEHLVAVHQEVLNGDL